MEVGNVSMRCWLDTVAMLYNPGHPFSRDRLIFQTPLLRVACVANALEFYPAFDSKCASRSKRGGSFGTDLGTASWECTVCIGII